MSEGLGGNTGFRTSTLSSIYRPKNSLAAAKIKHRMRTPFPHRLPLCSWCLSTFSARWVSQKPLF
jgi:hypothetical protein